MPGVVADYIRSVQQEQEMDALEELIHLIEEKYAPEPYDEEGLDDLAIKYLDRDYEADWCRAQRVASDELKTLQTKHPGMSAVQLLASFKEGVSK